MRAVNLLPRETRASRSVTAQNLPAEVGAGMGFLVVAVLAAGYLSAGSKVSTAQLALDDANAQLAATPLPPKAETPTNTTPPVVAAEQAPRLQAVSSALSQRIAWDRILREFSLVLPNDVWVSSVDMSAPSAGTTDGSRFTLSGTTYSYDSVARMLTRMNLIPDLTGVTLESTSRQDRLVQFGVSASVKGAAVPAAPAPAPAAAASTTTTETTTTEESGS